MTASAAPAAPTALAAPTTPASGPDGLDFDAVVRTLEIISAVLPETPAWSYPLLNAATGADVVVKHENVQMPQNLPYPQENKWF